MTTSLEDRGSVARNTLFTLTRKQLGAIASRAITLHGRAPEDFAVLTINVDDAKWGPLVDLLMPDGGSKHPEWQVIRDKGQIPVASGSIPWETVRVLCDLLPGIRNVLDHPPPRGEVYAFIFGDGGCSVYTVPFAPNMKPPKDTM